jgi:peptidoglycan-N-acetylglucosamine deacetylase
MQKNIAGLLWVSLLICIFFPGCTKFEKKGQCNQAGIALTFDDDRVDNWVQYLPFFDSAHIKATFYICKYNKFTPEQKQKLAIIQSHGHEIAFHSTNHYDMLKYVYKYKHTIDELMKNEIENGLKLMNRDGFYPTTFAYPYGAHNGIYDKKLLRYFKSVRALNGTSDFSKSLTVTEKNILLFGLDIDKSGKRSDGDILQLIQSAADNNNCAVLVGHDINNGKPLSVSRELLQKIFDTVKRLGLKYYTASEISN